MAFKFKDEIKIRGKINWVRGKREEGKGNRHISGSGSGTDISRE